MAKKKPAADVVQMTHFEPVTIPPESGKHAKLEARLAAAEGLIQAQSDLLDAWTLRKNRNPAMDAVFHARNAWQKAING